MALFYFTDGYEKRYNCSFYNFEDKSLEEKTNIFKGWQLLTTFVIAWALYIPCIIVMCDRALLKYSCYKLMLYLAFLDLNNTIYTGLWAGIASITGNVFCAWPTLAYWMGNLNGMAWKSRSPAAVLLAFNRCIEAYDQKYANLLFKGKKTFFWMILPFIWSGKDFLIGPPGIYNPVYSAINYNPHAGYYADDSYTNQSVFYNNVFCSLSIIIIYSIFGVLLVSKSKTTKYKNVAQTKAFGQIFCISAMLCFTAGGFILSLYIKLPPFCLYILSTAMASAPALTPIIYFTLNSTMREKIAKLFCKRKQKTSSMIEFVRPSNINARK